MIQKDEFLNDLEIESVKRFMGDKLAKEAVRKILLAGVYANGVLKEGEPASPTRNAAFGLLMGNGGAMRPVQNEQLGAELRAMIEGMMIVEEGFQKLERYAQDTEKATGVEETGE